MAQIDRKPQHLSDIVPEDMFVGTSLILRRGDRFLYGPRPLQEEGARQVIELTGIGLPNLIWLAPAQILETARRDVPLSKLLSAGAELIVGDAGPPPETSWVRLTDSQEALALALGENTPSFYESLG